MMLFVLLAFMHPTTEWLVHASPATLQSGRELYAQRCASCHGAAAQGGPNAPSLHGTGAAAADFWISTGRMPAAVPWLEVDHQPLKLAPNDITAIEAYLYHQDASGPAIPVVAPSNHLAHGRLLFTQNCEHCHGIGGDGASISNIEWAPNVHLADRVQIGEAIRTGPEQMPRFSDAQLSQSDVDDVAAYVASLDKSKATPQLPATTSGPVPEGLIGWLIVLALCLFGYIFSKDKPTQSPD